MGLGENVVFVDDETLDTDSFHFFLLQMVCWKGFKFLRKFFNFIDSL